MLLFLNAASSFVNGAFIFINGAIISVNGSFIFVNGTFFLFRSLVAAFSLQSDGSFLVTEKGWGQFHMKFKMVDSVECFATQPRSQGRLGFKR